MRKVIHFLLGFILIPVFSFSQVLDPVKWTFKVEQTKPDEATLLIIAKADKGWHLYSQNIPEAKTRPVPTTFTFKKSADYELIGKVTEPKAIEEYDPNFEMTLRYFADKTVFRQKIKILGKQDFTITGTVEFMCCDDHQCLPPNEVNITFNVKGNPEAITQTSTPVSATSEKSDSIDTTAIKTATVKQTTPAVTQPPTGESGDNGSLWLFFIIALGVGFAGALTPCVYPMIPMTVSFFMSSSNSKSGAKINALFYGVSIIVIYTFIGVLVTLLFGPDFIKNVSSYWATNLIFFLLFAAFAASFFGLFEIVLPSKLTNKADKQVDKGGLIGTFFMALTLVLVSFSCTAPFIGGILVEAATGSILKPIVGMFGFSLAFALPFTILAFFPSLLSKMPKSGGWLNSFKIVVGFLILAFGMKFLNVPNQALDWGITREVFIAVWIVLFTLLGFYLLGKIKFSHDSDIEHIGVFRLLLIILTFTFVVYLLPGMIGAPLKAVSGFMPSESSFNLIEIISSNRGSVAPEDNRSALCDKPKHGDLFKLPLGLDGYFDFEQGLACAKKLNKPIIIDFTGHGCVNCKMMEKNIWPDPEVLKRLKNDYIMISLYVDDRTELPESEWITSTVDKQVKKTIGKKNVDFEITRFNVNAQPYYVLMDTSGNILTAPKAFDLDADAFVKFLDTGLENFRKGENK
jgi:thiol:disulfide interchange protein